MARARSIRPIGRTLLARTNCDRAPAACCFARWELSGLGWAAAPAAARAYRLPTEPSPRWSVAAAARAKALLLRPVASEQARSAG
jgi:hypothetical protein